MKRKIPHTTKLIATDEEENRRKFDFFSALVRKQRLDKIEKTLEIPTPSDGFRDWLTKVLWRLHCNSQPDARVRSSRTTLKRVLQDSAKRADELKLFAEQIWTSGMSSRYIDVYCGILLNGRIGHHLSQCILRGSPGSVHSMSSRTGPGCLPIRLRG